ncbi:unnamed protein product [Sphagnum jensenii]|uniref:Uncharacterized protein n=1 Tax=Sphagnum jensenii TaxID=128206 RepID=A0ABP1ATY9_9BRYO
MKKKLHTNLAPGLFIVRVKSTSSMQALISSCPGSCVEYSDPIRTILASKDAESRKAYRTTACGRNRSRKRTIAEGSWGLKKLQHTTTKRKEHIQ